MRDDYGDYGFCGLYIMRAGPHGRHLLHFTFSCRILGLGVETWLYRHLKNPSLNVEGTVLTDVQNDGREIDWIGTGIALGGGGGSGSSETGNTPRGATRPLRTVLARGGCDMRAISHYFAIHADHVFEEFDVVRGGAYADGQSFHDRAAGDGRDGPAGHRGFRAVRLRARRF